MNYTETPQNLLPIAFAIYGYAAIADGPDADTRRKPLRSIGRPEPPLRAKSGGHGGEQLAPATLGTQACSAPS